MLLFWKDLFSMAYLLLQLVEETFPYRGHIILYTQRMCKAIFNLCQHKVGYISTSSVNGCMSAHEVALRLLSLSSRIPYILSSVTFQTKRKMIFLTFVAMATYAYFGIKPVKEANNGKFGWVIKQHTVHYIRVDLHGQV